MTVLPAQLRQAIEIVQAEQAWREETAHWGPAETADAVHRVLSGDGPEERLLARRLAVQAYHSYERFLWQCWPILEPSDPLEWTWFLSLICRALERVTRGEIRELLICMPPGFAKSLLASVFWPAWWWLRDPSQRFLTLSSSDRLKTKDSRRMREVLRSPWYRRLVVELDAAKRTPGWEISKDQDEKVYFENSARGGRFAYATGGSVTGDRGHGQIIDDPHQIKHVLGSTEQVAAALGKAHDKVDVVLPSRVIDRRKAWRVTIQQRVHQDDVAGRQIEDPDIAKIILPMHAFSEDHPWRHPEDPRAEGELLDPVRMPEELVQKEARKLERQAPGQARAQHEQQPVPAGGGTFQRVWMRHYTHRPERPPEPYHEIVTCMDATFGSKGKSASHVALCTWGRIGVKHYLLDRVRRRMSYVEMRQAARDQVARWKGHLVIEVKALGPALVEELKAELPAVIPFLPDPYGGKEARAQLSTPYWASGNVELPPIELCPWIIDWKNFVAAFPGTLERDDVDAMTTYFLWQHQRNLKGDNPVMRGLRGLAGR